MIAVLVAESAGQADRGAMTERLRTRMEEVTSRQLEVARLVAEGRTNPEIASALGITLDGAKYHVSELLGRLGLERRDEIAEWYRSERRGQRMRGFGGFFAGLFASAPKAFASAAAVTAVVALGAVFAIGLSGGRAEDGARAALSPSPTPTVFASEPGVHPPVGATGDASNLPPNVDGLRFILMHRLRSDVPEIVSWERVDWTTGCFDVDVPGGCPLSVSPVPGYRVVMTVDGEEYVVRTGLDVVRYALEAAPPVTPFNTVFRWTGDFEYMCIEVRVSRDGRGSITGCGEAPTAFVLGQDVVASRGSLEYVLSFGTLLSTAPAGEFELNGTPGITPTREQDRAAQIWGSFLAMGAYTGAVVEPITATWNGYGDVLCDALDLHYFGAVVRRDCGNDNERRVDYLDPTQLERFYSWLDRYQMFEREDPSVGVTFGGSGLETAPPEVEDEIVDWLTALAEAPPPTSGE